MSKEKMNTDENSQIKAIIDAAIAEPQKFNEALATNASKLGIEPEKVAKLNEAISELAKHPVSNSHMLAIKLGTIKLDTLDMSSFADLLVEDLLEDDIEVNSVGKLSKILDNPSNPDYHLEPQIIAFIDGMTPGQKNELKVAAKEDLHLNAFSGMLHFLKETWAKMAPTVDSIFDTCVEIGVDVLKGMVDLKFSTPALGEKIKDVLDMAEVALVNAYEPEDDVELAGADVVEA